MRHKVFGKKLNRDIKERKALFRSLVQALITHGKVKTTLPKAKAVSSLIEKLVTKAKDGSRASLNQVSSFLTKRDLIRKLTGEIAPKFSHKIGGYIRLVRLGKRAGDNAEEVSMEWTESISPQEKEKPKKGKQVEEKKETVLKEDKK